jgi:hypothetical protein
MELFAADIDGGSLGIKHGQCIHKLESSQAAVPDWLYEKDKSFQREHRFKGGVAKQYACRQPEPFYKTSSPFERIKVTSGRAARRLGR